MSATPNRTRPSVALLRPAPALAEPAQQWAQRLDLPLVDDGAEFDLLLRILDDDAHPGYRLALQATGSKAPGPVAAEFVAGALGHRRRFGGGRGQPLARAVGLKHGASPSIADLTAGLGRDAFVLASLGCRVQLVERVPLVAALLENGIARARADPEVAAIVARMDLHCTDALRWLETCTNAARVDVIYLDPMYPSRSKRALVKKEMQLFHTLIGGDDDAPALLELARARAGQRVVVKRPRRAAPLAGMPPQYAVTGPNTRYDVYAANG